MRNTLCIVVALALSTPCFAARAQDFPRGRDVRALIRTHGVTPRRWTAIVVHHSASTAGNAASFDAYHRGVRHWARGMAYHFVIGNGHGLGDGEIEVGPRWTRQQPGAHIASTLRDPDTRMLWDDIAIGIVLVGNFETSAPTRRQLETLDELVTALRRRFSIAPDRVVGHGEVAGAHTACPGASLHRVLMREREPHRRDERERRPAPRAASTAPPRRART